MIGEQLGVGIDFGADPANKCRNARRELSTSDTEKIRRVFERDFDLMVTARYDLEIALALAGWRSLMRMVWRVLEQGWMASQPGAASV